MLRNDRCRDRALEGVTQFLRRLKHKRGQIGREILTEQPVEHLRCDAGFRPVLVGDGKESDTQRRDPGLSVQEPYIRFCQILQRDVLLDRL